MDELLHIVIQRPRKRIAIAVAEGEETFKALQLAVKHRIADFLLYGDEKIIRKHMAEGQFPLPAEWLIHAASHTEACEKAVHAVHAGEADVLMKGLVHTSTFVRTILQHGGLRSERLLSHVTIFQLPQLERLLFVTDSGMNIHPTLEEKREITQNVIDLAHRLGIPQPKVAILAAIETVNPQMPVTIDAAALAKMADRGQIQGGIVDGPLALDNAISPASVKEKGVLSPVAGEADILVVPTLEAGNTLYKALAYLADARVGALLVGAKRPIILPSRADHAETKFHSMLFALAQDY